MIIYDENIFNRLKDKGFSTYKIRKEKLISERTLQSIRDNKSVTVETIDVLCRLLNCQPGDIMSYTPDSIEQPSDQ